MRRSNNRTIRKYTENMNFMSGYIACLNLKEKGVKITGYRRKKRK